MNRKTATILAVAAGLVAAAVILSQRAKGRAIADPADPGADIIGAPIPGTCAATGRPARHRADFAHGSLTAALSSTRVLAAGGGEMWVAVDIAARDAVGQSRPPMNLAIVIDRSGSMDGDKLEQARQAAAGIVARLGEKDRVALVQYDDDAQVVVPSATMDETGRARLLAAIGSLTTGGSTNLESGMQLGVGEVSRELAAGRINRVILLSDGLANVGVVDGPTIARSAGAFAEKGVRITTVGVGLDYNEDLMEAIAESGRGNYYFVKDAMGLDAVFAGEIRAMQATVATHTQLRLEPACAGVEILEVYGYDSRKDGGAQVVPMADLFGGDRRKVVVRLRVPAAAAGKLDVLSARLAYDDAATGAHMVSAVALGVVVTADADAVAAGADKDVMSQVVQVESARAKREAAHRYDRGDVIGAQSLLKQQRANVANQARLYALPPEATAPVYDEIDSQVGGQGRYAPESAEGKALVKGSKAASRKMSK